jgi:hypothetical protein
MTYCPADGLADHTFQTLAMPMKRDINVEISSLSAFATSTGAPPSTATGSPAVGTCFDAVHDAVGTVQDACGSLSSAFGGDPDSDHALLATGACKSVSAAAISAIVNTCGQALGVNVSGKNASALTAADFPDNQDAFNSGRSMGGPTTLCAQVSSIFISAPWHLAHAV